MGLKHAFTRLRQRSLSSPSQPPSSPTRLATPPPPYAQIDALITRRQLSELCTQFGMTADDILSLPDETLVGLFEQLGQEDEAEEEWGGELVLGEGRRLEYRRGGSRRSTNASTQTRGTSWRENGKEGAMVSLKPEPAADTQPEAGSKVPGVRRKATWRGFCRVLAHPARTKAGLIVPTRSIHAAAAAAVGNTTSSVALLPPTPASTPTVLRFAPRRLQNPSAPPPTPTSPDIVRRRHVAVPPPPPPTPTSAPAPTFVSSFPSTASALTPGPRTPSSVSASRTARWVAQHARTPPRPIGTNLATLPVDEIEATLDAWAADFDRRASSYTPRPLNVAERRGVVVTPLLVARE